jgi:hypothetical protein
LVLFVRRSRRSRTRFGKVGNVTSTTFLLSTGKWMVRSVVPLVPTLTKRLTGWYDGGSIVTW